MAVKTRKGLRKTYKDKTTGYPAYGLAITRQSNFGYV